MTEATKTDIQTTFDLSDDQLNRSYLYISSVPAPQSVTMEALTTAPPKLPFKDNTFDFVLCDEGLFTAPFKTEAELYEAVDECLRVGKELRVFPVLDEQGHPSALLGPLLLRLQQHEIGSELREVRPTETTAAGQALLRIWREACEIEVQHS